MKIAQKLNALSKFRRVTTTFRQIIHPLDVGRIVGVVAAVANVMQLATIPLAEIFRDNLDSGIHIPTRINLGSPVVNIEIRFGTRENNCRNDNQRRRDNFAQSHHQLLNNRAGSVNQNFHDVGGRGYVVQLRGEHREYRSTSGTFVDAESPRQILKLCNVDIRKFAFAMQTDVNRIAEYLYRVIKIESTAPPPGRSSISRS